MIRAALFSAPSEIERGGFLPEVLRRDDQAERWVLNWYSQRQGSPETYAEIDESTAVAWLISNEADELGSLPQVVQDAVGGAMAELEM